MQSERAGRAKLAAGAVAPEGAGRLAIVREEHGVIDIGTKELLHGPMGLVSVACDLQPVGQPHR
jgi:hypothetical protein